MSSADAALRLSELSKSFGRICAVNRLSLEVCAGQMVGFLGPNGAGKSTTLYMIAGLVRPSGGQIEIFGHDVSRDFKAAMSQVGVMVEWPAFYEYLSGRRKSLTVGLHTSGQGQNSWQRMLVSIRMMCWQERLMTMRVTL